MADEPTLEQAIADNRATDPRLEMQALEPGLAPEPAPEPAPAPVEAAADPEVDPEAPPAEPTPKPKRSAEEVLKGRVGHLTKTLSAKDTALAETQAKLAAAEALLAAHGRTPPPDGETPPAPAVAPARTDLNPTTGRTYSEAEFEAAVVAKAEADTFNKQANAIYNLGAEKFPDWKESVELLNATGLMSRDLLDATMATGDETTGAAVLHHLGTDVEEAERIAKLPTARMAAELTKLAIKLTASAPLRVSGAPAPIPSVRGAVNPVVDLDRAAAQGDNDMSAYREARAKQGARWAQARGERAPR